MSVGIRRRVRIVSHKFALRAHLPAGRGDTPRCWAHHGQLPTRALRHRYAHDLGTPVPSGSLPQPRSIFIPFAAAATASDFLPHYTRPPRWLFRKRTMSPITCWTTTAWRRWGRPPGRSGRRGWRPAPRSGCCPRPWHAAPCAGSGSDWVRRAGRRFRAAGRRAGSTN